jgi:hypothetical protein
MIEPSSEFLRALSLDPQAVSRLMDLEVECNQDMADHPIFREVAVYYDEQTLTYRLTVRGLLQALTGKTW